MARIRFTAGAAALVALALSTGAEAQVSDGVVKLGVLSDMSSLYSDATGKGSLVAAQMAVEDFGGKVLGKPIEVVFRRPSEQARYRRQHRTAVVRPGAGRCHRRRADLVGGARRPTDQQGQGPRFPDVGPGQSSDLTGPACSPTGVHWTYDTYALSHVAGKAMVERGENTWFFITADYAFGHALERDATDVVKASGGKVLGSVRHPLNTQDFSSFLLQAQASGAKVVALANAGGDTQNAIKQAAEFGLQKSGQKLLALLIQVTDIHSLGLRTAQGMILTEGFYWDQDDGARKFSQRFFAKLHFMPTMIQAGVYSEVTHYLKAIQAAGTDEAKAVVAKMRALPINDFFAHNGKLREDGRMVHDMYLMQVKTPAESKGEWDLYKILATVPGDQAYRPLDQGACPLVAGH